MTRAIRHRGARERPADEVAGSTRIARGQDLACPMTRAIRHRGARERSADQVAGSTRIARGKELGCP